ncbi:MAG: hypothetical protein ACI9LN_001749 [Saprospiraceae bacterium]|jgi:hypothetical protein
MTHKGRRGDFFLSMGFKNLINVNVFRFLKCKMRTKYPVKSGDLWFFDKFSEIQICPCFNKGSLRDKMVL